MTGGEGDDDDAELIAGALLSQTDALARIYELRSADVHTLARRLCGRHADDVVRSVFLALWRAPSAYDHTAGPSPTTSPR